MEYAKVADCCPMFSKNCWHCVGYLIWLLQQEKLECDFKGGAGATCVPRRSINESGVKHVEQQSPEHEQEELLSESQNDSKEFMELTPTRRSTRAAGKKFKYMLWPT